MIKLNLKKSMWAAIVIYLILLVSIYALQRKLQYHPSGEIAAPAAYSLVGFEVKNLTTKDNDRILAWYKKPDHHKKIIVYFHGNAGNMGGRADKFKIFASDGYGVLAISYSGYYGSSGKSSEQALINDGKAALDFLYSQGYKPQDIILFGESLGSGIAVQLAAQDKFFAVILEAPYSSIANVAQRTYWFVPVDLLLKDRFDSIKYAAKITSPTLIFHGTADHVVPYAEGQKLFAAIKSEKQFITVEGAGHLQFDNQFLLEKANDFLKLPLTKASGN